MRARFAISFERGSARHCLRRRAARAGLEIRADEQAMLVLADPRTPAITRSDSALIGQVFDREWQRITDIGSAFLSEDAAPRNGGWGNFAHFRAACGGPYVYRDPSGSIPVYQVTTNASDVFVSDAELAHSLGLLERAEIDIGFAVHWLQFPFLRGTRTGICSVRELLPGCVRRQMDGCWLDEPGWKPWEHARRTTESFDRLVEELRATVLDSLAAQAEGTSPMLQLSGGLDSSIIAASLAQSGISFSSVNFASRTSEGDERRHARLVAERFNSPLTEIVEDELEFCVRVPPERSFRPGSNPVLVPLDEAATISFAS